MKHKIILLGMEKIDAKHRVKILSIWNLDTDAIYENV